MGKRERKREIIQKYLPNCSTWSVYTYGNIPKSRIDGACKSYAGSVDYNEVLGLIDETVFGSRKKGFLFTVDGFYTDGNNKFLRYSDGISYKSLGAGYNLTAMNEMLDKLYQIESEPSGWDIAGALLGGAFDFLQAWSDNSDTSENMDTAKDGFIESEVIEPDEIVDESNFIDVENDDDWNNKTRWDLIITYLKSRSTMLQFSLLQTDWLQDSSEMIDILHSLQNEDLSIEESCDEIIKSADEEKGIIKAESAYSFEKNSRRFQNKLKYYISELNMCDEDEKKDILEDCKTEISGYQKILEREISQLKQIRSVME